MNSNLKFAMKSATKLAMNGLPVLFLLVAATALDSCRQSDPGDGGTAVGKVPGGAAGWGITYEGKVIAAAFLDAHNKFVVQARALGVSRAR